jgi:hypothetical protein
MPTRVPAGHPAFDLATPLPRCRACVRRSAPRGNRATCGSGTGGPRPARSVDIPQPTRGATSAPARCDRQTPEAPTGTAERPVRASREPLRGPRRGAPRSCVTPRERCHERRCISVYPSVVCRGSGSPLLGTAALCPNSPRRPACRAIINRRSASPCRPGCPRGTRRSISRHRSRGVAHVSGAPRHGAQGHLRLGYRGPPTGPVGRHPTADARCDVGTRAMRSSNPGGPDRHRRTPRPRVTRAVARATARSAEVMRDTAGAVSRALM